MILFFANNRALQRYFGKISALLDDGSRVYRPARFALPLFTALFWLPTEWVRQKIALAEKDAIHLNDRLFFLKKYLYRFWIRWLFACDVRVLVRYAPERIVVWNGLKLRRSLFVEAARYRNIPCIFMENGLLPDTTVCDASGVNALNSVPRNPDFYRHKAVQPSFSAADLVVRTGKLDKKASRQALPERFLFVPFQVDYDTQIVLFSDWIHNMEQLFNEVLAAAEGCGYQLVFKEHPSSKIDYRHLHQTLPAGIGMFANDYPTQTLIQQAAAVVTVNSTVGIESLMFGKKVIVLGQAFYAIDGLVLSAADQQALQDAVNALEDFRPDETLRSNFLHYLQQEYLIAGNWRQADDVHCRQVRDRLMAFAGQTAVDIRNDD